MNFQISARRMRTACVALPLCCAAYSFSQTQYLVTVAGPYLEPASMNQFGMMVGSTYASTAHAWDLHSGWTAIPGFNQPTQYGYQGVEANAVNGSGLVVGQSQDANQVLIPFMWDRVNGLRAIPGLPAGYCYVNGVNDEQHIVGQMYPMGSGQPFAYLWKPGLGNVQLPGLQQGAQTDALMINNSDAIVGYAAESNLRHTVIWMPDESIVDLGIPPGGNDNTPFCLNDLNCVVGYATTATSTEGYFRDGNGHYTVLTNFVDSAEWMVATGINNHNVVSGWLLDSHSQQDGYIWDAIHGYTLLNAHLAPGSAGWTINAACCINDSGQIAATGTYAGQSYGVLLTPLFHPLPPSVAHGW